MTRYRILAVDDEADELELFERFFGKTEYDIVTTSSSEEAIELLRKECWDVLITDICMPAHDGFEVIAEGMAQNKNIKCIAITGYGTEAVLTKVLSHDCFGYINKPFDWDYLKLLVHKAVRPTSQQSRRLRKER
ncbi:MAG: response regulator [Planctomycetota bacterium]|jgi:DNA-binding NtrC family response regulator